MWLFPNPQVLSQPEGAADHRVLSGQLSAMVTRGGLSVAWFSEPSLGVPRQRAAESMRSLPHFLQGPLLPRSSGHFLLTPPVLQGWGSRLRAREAAALELKAQVTRDPSGLTQMVPVCLPPPSAVS